MIIIRSCNQWVFSKTVCCRYCLPRKIKLFFSVWSTTGKKVLRLIWFFWELKMESVGEATSKETCFSMYLQKGKVFIQLFWPLRFTMVAKKKTTLRRISHTMKKNLIKSDVVNTSYELKAYKSTSWNSKVLFQIHESQIQIHELRVLKSFSNSWGNSSVQFLVIILCFTFQLFHGYGLSRKQCEKILTLKEEI